MYIDIISHHVMFFYKSIFVSEGLNDDDDDDHGVEDDADYSDHQSDDSKI